MKKGITLTILLGLVTIGALLGMLLCLVAATFQRETKELEQVATTRLALFASLQTLNGKLLASNSATLTLEGWCKDHELAGEPKIIAIPNAGANKEVTSALRDTLKVNAAEPIKYRQVQLKCGDKVLSEADNWYVPGRLTPQMNTELETTNTPFGKVITSLQPNRKTLDVETLWEVLPANWDTMSKNELQKWVKSQPDPSYDAGRSMFKHQAVVLRTSDSLPVSVVHETYKMTLLASFFGK